MNILLKMRQLSIITGVTTSSTSILLILCTVIKSSKGHADPLPVTKEILPTKAWAKKTCNLDVYKLLFHEMLAKDSLSNDITLISLLTTGSFDESRLNGTQYFGDYLEQLCLSIDENKVIDLHALDCIRDNGPDASCDCGFAMNSFDPNVPQGETKPGEVKSYTVTKGLDRKLKHENGACVSGHQGHCTMDDTNMTLIPLKCGHSLECKPMELNGRLFRNNINLNEYGFCVHRHHEEEAENSLTASIDVPNSASIFGLGSISKFKLSLFVVLWHNFFNMNCQNLK